MKIEELKDKIEKATVSLATVNKYNKPHNIVIMYAKIKDGKIIITNNYMHSTINNIQYNPNVSLVFWDDFDGFRIDGRANYFDSGEWLDFVKNIPENDGEPSNGAIVIEIENIDKLG